VAIPKGANFVYPARSYKMTHYTVGTLAVFALEYIEGEKNANGEARQRAIVGTAMPGSAIGQWHILPIGGAIIQDRAIQWFSPVEAISF
jgi:hypothetical protein